MSLQDLGNCSKRKHSLNLKDKDDVGLFKTLTVHLYVCDSYENTLEDSVIE